MVADWRAFSFGIGPEMVLGYFDHLFTNADESLCERTTRFDDVVSVTSIDYPWVE